MNPMTENQPIEPLKPITPIHLGNPGLKLVDINPEIAYPAVMNQSRSLSDLSVTELRKVLHIKEQIAALENRLDAVLGGSAKAASVTAPSAKRVAGKRGGRRKLSPEARERIAAAQRARWAAVRSKAGK